VEAPIHFSLRDSADQIKIENRVVIISLLHFPEDSKEDRLLLSPISILRRFLRYQSCYYLHSPFFRRLQRRPVLIISIFISSEDFLDIRGRYQNALTLHNLLKAQSTMVVHNLLLEKLDGYQYDPCHSYPATRVNLLKFIDLNPPLESTLSVKRLASSDL